LDIAIILVILTKIDFFVKIKFMLNPRLETISAKTLIGMSTLTAPSNSKAKEVWSSFMPMQKNVIGKEEGIFYSVQEYPSNYPFMEFNPQATFTTWAAKEVGEDMDVPEEFKILTISGGTYVVCEHIGVAAEIGNTIGFIFGQWIPKNGYTIDLERKHFEVLAGDYLGPANPESKEMVWIPIKKISDF